MTGREEFRSKLAGFVEKMSELDESVADDTGIGCSTGGVLSQEVRKDALFEGGAKIDNVVLDTEEFGRSRGAVGPSVRRPIRLSIAIGAGTRSEAVAAAHEITQRHRQTDNIVTFAKENESSYRTIDTAAHRNDDSHQKT